MKAFAKLFVGVWLAASVARAAEPPAAPASPTIPSASVAPPAPTPPVPEISASALRERLASNDAQLAVIDVRTPEEFAAGHVPGAINLPLQQLPAALAEHSNLKDRELVLYCRSGARAAAASAILKSNGFTRLLHLTGDIGAWEQSGATVQTTPSPTR